MTPQERILVDDLFDRLAKLESAPRDPDAEQAIRAGIAKAPNALYALVQSVLVQDEALRRADEHIRELEGGGRAPDDGRPHGFLDNMRDALFGGGANRQGSVPTVRLGEQPTGAPQYRPSGYSAPAGGQAPYPQQPGYSPGGGGFGGSFLGTAAAAAAGMIGGGLLLSGIRSMLGGGYGNQGAFGNTFNQISDNPVGGSSSPWSNAGGSDLSREAGLDDIGSGGQQSVSNDTGGGQGMFDPPSSDDVGGDSGGFDGGGGGDTP